MSLQTNKKRMLYFSAISLSDIVLLVLIFFLLSSTFIVQPGIKVYLPKAATGVPDAMASSTTRPNVSVRLGKTKTSALA